MIEFDEELKSALNAVSNFIKETTGEEPTSGEIARAMKRYFVMIEIKDHVLVEREGDDEA